MRSALNPHDRGGGERDPRDRYETPTWVTDILTRNVVLPRHDVFEPACGSGIMAVALEQAKLTVTASDIASGRDFLDCRDRHAAVVTNPPYKDRLPERFLRHAMDNVATEVVALLVATTFLGSKRRHGIFTQEYPPSRILIISKRILFLVNGKPISGQAYDHCWMVWYVGYKGPATTEWCLP